MNKGKITKANTQPTIQPLSFTESSVHSPQINDIWETMLAGIDSSDDEQLQASPTGNNSTLANDGSGNMQYASLTTSGSIQQGIASKVRSKFATEEEIKKLRERDQRRREKQQKKNQKYKERLSEKQFEVLQDFLQKNDGLFNSAMPPHQAPMPPQLELKQLHPELKQPQPEAAFEAKTEIEIMREREQRRKAKQIKKNQKYKERLNARHLEVVQMHLQKNGGLLNSALPSEQAQIPPHQELKHQRHLEQKQPQQKRKPLMWQPIQKPMLSHQELKQPHLEPNQPHQKPRPLMWASLQKPMSPHPELSQPHQKTWPQYPYQETMRPHQERRPVDLAVIPAKLQVPLARVMSLNPSGPVRSMLSLYAQMKLPMNLSPEPELLRNANIAHKLEDTKLLLSEATRIEKSLSKDYMKTAVQAPTGSKKYQVVFLSNRPGGEISTEEGEWIQKYVVNQMLCAMMGPDGNPTGTELQIIDSGIAPSNFFVVTLANEESHRWLLRECPPYQDGNFVATPVPAEDPPAIISFCVKKQEKVDVPKLIEWLALQNHKLQIESWKHVTTKGKPGNWELNFEIPGIILPVLKAVDWRLYYALSFFTVQHDSGASEVLGRNTFKDTQRQL